MVKATSVVVSSLTVAALAQGGCRSSSEPGGDVEEHGAVQASPASPSNAGTEPVLEPWEHLPWLVTCPDSADELFKLASARAEPAEDPAAALSRLEAAFAAMDLPAWRAAEIEDELARAAEAIKALEDLRLSPEGDDVVALAGTLDDEHFAIVADVPRATAWSLRRGYTSAFHRLSPEAGLIASCTADVPLHHLAWGSAALELTARPELDALRAALDTLEAPSGEARRDATALADAVDGADLPRAAYYFFPQRAW